MGKSDLIDDLIIGLKTLENHKKRLVTRKCDEFLNRGVAFTSFVAKVSEVLHFRRGSVAFVSFLAFSSRCKLQS